MKPTSNPFLHVRGSEENVDLHQPPIVFESIGEDDIDRLLEEGKRVQRTVKVVQWVCLCIVVISFAALAGSILGSLTSSF